MASYSKKNDNTNMNTRTISKSGLLIWLFLGLSSMINGVDAIAAGRRRRRSLYNIRPCGPGQKAIWSPSKKSVSSCVSCLVGEYRSDTQHSLEGCNVCEGGRYSSSDLSYCIGEICKAGTFGTKGVDVCNACVAGKYSMYDGSFSCKDCESGRFSGLGGAKECRGEMCPAGKWGVGSAASAGDVGMCHTCRAGKFSLAGYVMCISCSEGQFSNDNASSCTEHAHCSSDSYPDNPPVASSDILSCSRCIHASDLYFAAYLIACTIAIMNTLLFVYDHKKNCYVLLFIISPGIWAFGLNICKSKPGDVPAIISIIMNTICLVPVYGIVKQWVIQINVDRTRAAEFRKAVAAQQLPITDGMVHGVGIV